LHLVVFTEFWEKIERFQQVKYLLSFAFYFNPQDGGESGLRMAECTFREVGCLAAVHPDEMATHLDTQIHYHTGVCVTSEFHVAQTLYKVCARKNITGKTMKKYFTRLCSRFGRTCGTKLSLDTKYFSPGRGNKFYADINIPTASGADSLFSSMEKSIISQG
jgi:hypothetical protein